MGEHPSNHSVRYVSLDLGRKSRVIVYEQGGGGQELLELEKHSFIVISKSEDHVLIYKLI